VARGLIQLAAGVAVLSIASPALAGDADVIAATFDRRPSGVYDFDVTVRSKDTDWEHYADQIQVLAPDGRVLQTRVLEHPHEQEQPFTRDVMDVRVPSGVTTVRIRARFKPTGWGGAELDVPLRK
jgi:hypothetical protein